MKYIDKFIDFVLLANILSLADLRHLILYVTSESGNFSVRKDLLFNYSRRVKSQLHRKNKVRLREGEAKRLRDGKK